MPLMNEAEALKKLYWTDPAITVDTLKQRLLAACQDILDSNDMDWGDFRTSRTWDTREPRKRICATAWLVLKPWMSEHDIAEFLGIKRSRMRSSALQFFKDQREQITKGKGEENGKTSSGAAA